jgi:hypothetical protein
VLIAAKKIKNKSRRWPTAGGLMSTVRRGTILKIRGRAADPASYGKEGRTRCLIFATSYKTRQVKYICAVYALIVCLAKWRAS